MAWRCSGGSNAALVDNLWRHGLITDEAVREAFLRVDRAHYAPASPYDDAPQPIGHGATISAPHMHAAAAEHLLPRLRPPPSPSPGSPSPSPAAAAAAAPRVLDVGSGSGYLTHVLAELVGERGLVVGVEHIAELRDLGEANMRKSPAGARMLDAGRVRFRLADGRLGLREDPRPGEEAHGSAWDAIHVGAAAAEVHPQLLDQLKAPGRCVCFPPPYYLSLVLFPVCVCVFFFALFAFARALVLTRAPGEPQPLHPRQRRPLRLLAAYMAHRQGRGRQRVPGAPVWRPIRALDGRPKQGLKRNR